MGWNHQLVDFVLLHFAPIFEGLEISKQKSQEMVLMDASMIRLPSTEPNSSEAQGLDGMGGGILLPCGDGLPLGGSSQLVSG